jgi:hypothetical protein
MGKKGRKCRRTGRGSEAYLALSAQEEGAGGDGSREERTGVTGAGRAQGAASKFETSRNDLPFLEKNGGRCVPNSVNQRGLCPSAAQ